MEINDERVELALRMFKDDLAKLIACDDRHELGRLGTSCGSFLTALEVVGAISGERGRQLSERLHSEWQAAIARLSK